MPSTGVGLLSALLLHAATPERVVLLNDTNTATIEARVVSHVLRQTLAADASVELVAERPLTPPERRAATLARSAARHLARAHASLDGLALESVLTEAAQARTKIFRVAELTGDCSSLPEALELLVTGLLLVDAEAAATSIIAELLAFEPTWRPSEHYFNPGMQQFVARTKDGLNQGTQRRLEVQTDGAANAAIFIDGALQGFGTAQVTVSPASQHLIWVLAEDGRSQARLVPARRPALGASETGKGTIAMALGTASPRATTPPSYALARLASQSEHLTINLPSAFAAMGVHRLFCLAERRGELVLTQLAVAPQSRRRSSVTAQITTWGDAKGAVQALLQAPPALEPVPLPPVRAPE